MKLSFDTGKKNTKMSFQLGSQFENILYLSNVSLNANRINTTSQSEIITFNERRYLIGENGMNSFLENRSEMDKTNDVHRLLVLTGICKALKASGLTECDNVQIAINVPLAFYKSPGEQERIINFYKNDNKEYVVEMEQETYKFKISEVLPYFEGIGPLLVNRKGYEGKEVICLDLGSLNTAYATFDNLRPVGNLCNNFNDGVDNLLAVVGDILLKHNLSNLSEKNVQDIIKGIYTGKISEEAQVEVDQACLEHLQQLQYTLFNRKLNLKLPIVVCGGGAVLLERFFKEVFEDVEVSPKALFVNADGGLELLE